MATRSRTALFLSHRRARAPRGGMDGSVRMNDLRSGFGDGAMVGSGVGAGAIALDIPPQWLDATQDIDDVVTQIKHRMASLARLHSKHLSQVAISSGPGGDADAHEIEAVTSEITRLLSAAKTKVKHLCDADPLSQETDQDIKIKKNLTSAYALQLQDLMGKFRASQEKYLSRMKSREERTKGSGAFDDFGLSRRPGGASSSAAGAGGVGGSGGADGFDDFSGYVDSGFSFEQEQVVADSDAMIQERSAEIQNIYQSIVDLAEMFKDLSLLVIEQGTLLDQIDYNVEQVVQHTESAVKQLEKGNKYHKAYRTKLIILLLIIMIVAMVIVLVVRKKSQ